MATTIQEAVTTIPAGTLRLLLTSISYRAKARKEMRRKPSMVPRRPPRPCCCTAPPGKGCQADRCQIANRRADHVQVEAMTPQRVRRAQHLPAIRTQWEKTPPGLHGLRYSAPSYMPYYNRAVVMTCAASGRDGGIWYVLEVLRRCDTLQRGASGVIVDCIGLVSLAAE